ncbi:hypothetical protein CMEL01_00381 [Colletotrichum melonis]|uniref:Uncharacterized protein n=1 Tax=Colletotrichum melonis TaxID=1209925 RepID=A0AAI9Y184_9PEZI|nr:hypothetical protein CMEL01_00381 [Colletotrichum melonis]
MWNMSCPTMVCSVLCIPEVSHESQTDVSSTSRRIRGVPHVAPQPPGKAVSSTRTLGADCRPAIHPSKRK